MAHTPAVEDVRAADAASGGLLTQGSCVRQGSGLSITAAPACSPGTRSPGGRPRPRVQPGEPLLMPGIALQQFTALLAPLGRLLSPVPLCMPATRGVRHLRPRGPDACPRQRCCDLAAWTHAAAQPQRTHRAVDRPVGGPAGGAVPGARRGLHEIPEEGSQRGPHLPVCRLCSFK